MTFSIPSVRTQDMVPGVYADEEEIRQPRLWEKASPFNKVGRDPLATPEHLWECCCAYFEWATETPLMTIKTYSNEGRIIAAQIPKTRAFTVKGLCLYIGISPDTWYKLGGRGAVRPRSPYTSRGEEVMEQFRRVTETANDIIFEQKFTGAASDLFNASIITRDLGLVDKKEVESNITTQTVVQYQLPDNGRVMKEVNPAYAPVNIEDAETNVYDFPETDGSELL